MSGYRVASSSWTRLKIKLGNRVSTVSNVETIAQISIIIIMIVEVMCRNITATTAVSVRFITFYFDKTLRSIMLLFAEY